MNHDTDIDFFSLAAGFETTNMIIGKITLASERSIRRMANASRMIRAGGGAGDARDSREIDSQ